MSQEALRKIALQVRNWGRWGPDDEIGTLNFITPDAIARASRLVTAGKVFALGIPLQREGPQSGTRQRFNPIHSMFRDGGDQPRTPAEVEAMQGYGGSDDWIVMPLQCATQWDSLAHIFDEGKMWNGYDATLVTSSGAAKNSIDKTSDKIVGRGVLLDVARWKGVRALEPGYAITVEDLEATAAAEGVVRRARRHPPRPHRPHDPLPGSRRLALFRPRPLPRRLRAHRALDARQGDRGGGQRQLRGRGPPVGDHRLPQSVPRLRDPQHGPHPRRDLLPREPSPRTAWPTAGGASSWWPRPCR